MGEVKTRFHYEIASKQGRLELKGKLPVGIGSIISILVIGWIVYKVDLDELWRAFDKVDGKWLIMMVLVYLTGFLIRGLRWQMMLRPVKPISYSVSTSVIIMGYMANNFLPVRLGEIVRAYMLSEKEDVSKVSALASIIVERIFDGFVLLGIFAVTTLKSAVEAKYSAIFAMVGLWSGIIFLLGLSTILSLRLKPLWIKNLEKTVISILPSKSRPRFESICHSMVKAVAFLRIDWTLPIFLFLSVSVWIEGSMFWLNFLAFGLKPDLQFAYFTLALVNLGLLVPAGPAYVGVFQGFTILAFAAFGLQKEAALSYSLIIHGVQFLSISMIGLVLLNTYGMSLWRGHNLRKRVRAWD